MATRSATLPIERSYLVKAWFAVATIVIVAFAVVAIALAARGAPPGGTGPEPVGDGPGQVQNEPIVVNGNVCGQCR